MKYIAGLFVFMASMAFAGGSQGGGTPPAREQLVEMLMAQPAIDGGLFDNGLGDISILTRSRLQPQMTVANRDLVSADIESPIVESTPKLNFSKEDFAALRDRLAPIDATGAEGQNLSFKIEAGNTADTMILKDRRELMRAAIK
jgi:hypothetical protein